MPKRFSSETSQGRRPRGNWLTHWNGGGGSETAKKCRPAVLCEPAYVVPASCRTDNLVNAETVIFYGCCTVQRIRTQTHRHTNTTSPVVPLILIGTKLYVAGWISLGKNFPPFPQIDIIGAVVIVWRVRGKTIRSVLCNIVCNNCAQCDAHSIQ